MYKINKREYKNFLWNAIAGIINAAETVIMSIVITRVTGLNDAGIVTISFSIGNLLMTIGKFGIRNFQVTDVKERYTFKIYLKTRLITVFGMIIASVIYIGYAYAVRDYSLKKAFCVFLICMIYVVESVEDVYWGMYQKQGRLDIGAKIFIIRWVGIFVLFSTSVFLSKSLVVALLYSFIYSVIVDFLLFWMYGKKTKIIGYEEKTIMVFSLLKECFPLFLSSFLSFYIINASKYAIDSFLSDTIQACYGFVAMPVFVISLLNGFIYQPLLAEMAIEWNEKNINIIKARIHRQCLFIFGLTAICEIGAYIIGIPVLSWLYHTDLGSYKRELLILLLGGGFLAIVGFFSTILTMMRCQKQQLYGYLAIAAAAFVFSKPLVKRWGSIGAAVLYLILTICLAFVFVKETYRQIKVYTD